MAVAKKKAAAQSEVQKIMANALKKYDMRVGTLADTISDERWISTGNMLLDYAVGQGFPLGRSVELYGPPSCGKTTTALQAAASLQKIIRSGGDAALGIAEDDMILYMDYEGAMDKDYAIALGLDVFHESFAIAQPDTLEDGANFVIEMLNTGKVRMVIFDSVAMMNPSAKADAEIGKSLPAVQAKLMTDFGNNLNTVLKKNNALCIYLNHEKELMEMGGRPGAAPRRSTPGGKALKYFVSVRVRFSQIGNNREEYTDPITNEKKNRITSTDVAIKVEKNKVSNPFREAKVRVRFGRGFDNFWSALQVLIAQKKIVSNAGRFYFHRVADLDLAPEWMAREKQGTERPYIWGAQSVLDAADEHEDWREGLILLAEELVRSIGAGRAVVENDSATEGEDDEEEFEKPSLVGGKSVSDADELLKIDA